jgi:hypothetical protein
VIPPDPKVLLVDLDYSVLEKGYIPNQRNNHFRGQLAGATLWAPREHRRNPYRLQREGQQDLKLSYDADQNPAVHGLRSEPCIIPEAAGCVARKDHNVGHSYGYETAASLNRLSSEPN